MITQELRDLVAIQKELTRAYDVVTSRATSIQEEAETIFKSPLFFLYNMCEERKKDASSWIDSRN